MKDKEVKEQNIKLRKEYIDTKTKYFFYQYIYKKFLEAKYNLIFGTYEIEKMQNIYDSFIYDKTIENRFFLAMSNSNINIDLEKLIAKTEYKDLKKQIDFLKYKKYNSKDRIEEIKYVLENDVMDVISLCIDLYDPYLNNVKEDEEWLHLLDFLKYDRLKSILEMEKYLNKEDEETYLPENIEDEIKKINKEIESMEEYFPMNQEYNFYSEDNINKKIDEIKTEINKSKKTLSRITNVYLYTNENKGLES